MRNIKCAVVTAAVLPIQWLIFVGLVMAQPLLPAFQPDTSEKSNSIIPQEPGWNDPAYRGWESLSIPGLIATYYDLDGDRNLDYMVIRKVLRKVNAEALTIEQAIETAQRDGMSLYISHPIIYFTEKHPLFYCLGVDYRRNCRDIWVDVAEDGLNGNEDLYTLSTPKPNVR